MCCLLVARRALAAPTLRAAVPGVRQPGHRALLTDPELLLLDEPAAGLDLGGREDLVSTLSVLAMDADSPATVLVSHHVEEIPPGFTHALLLREGRVMASGLLDHVVTEANLSATFAMPLVLSHEDGRWAARRKSRHAAG